MIEVHDMVVHVLRGDHQVADQLRIGRDRVVERILDRAHRGETVHQGADAADALGKGPGVARVAAAQDDLDTAHHGAGRIGLLDPVAVHLRLDAQMAFDAGDGIDDDAFVHEQFLFSGASRAGVATSLGQAQHRHIDVVFPPTLPRCECGSWSRPTPGRRPRWSSWLFLRPNARRRSSSARSLELTPPPAPQHQFIFPASGISTRLSLIACSRLRGASKMPPRRAIWQGS